MSLDWNISDIENYKEVCWKKNPENPENNILNPITETLIFMTIRVGINKITEDNVYDFYLRGIVTSEVYGKPITVWENENYSKRDITIEEIKQHIGLKTNADNVTNNKFMDNMSDSAKRYLD